MSLIAAFLTNVASPTAAVPDDIVDPVCASAGKASALAIRHAIRVVRMKSLLRCGNHDNGGNGAAVPSFERIAGILLPRSRVVCGARAAFKSENCRNSWA